MGNSLSVTTMVAMTAIILTLIPVYSLFVPLEQTMEDHQEVSYTVHGHTITADVHEGHFRMPVPRSGLPLAIWRLAEPDDCIRGMAETIREQTGMDGYRLVLFVHRLVHSIEYVTDDESCGVPDHWNTPCDTLLSGCGDCEDHAILFVALCTALGFECVFVLEPNHISAAVLVDGPGQTVTYGGEEYLYADTTTDYPGKSLSEDHLVMPMGRCWIHTASVVTSLGVSSLVLFLWILCIREANGRSGRHTVC